MMKMMTFMQAIVMLCSKQTSGRANPARFKERKVACKTRGRHAKSAAQRRRNGRNRGARKAA